MIYFAHESRFLKILTHSLATKRHLAWPLFLLLFLGSASGSAAAGAQVRNVPVPAARPGLSFAIADFDGDLRPDLASVQTGRSNFFQTDYWIQLRLTTVGRQSVQVVGPNGGLQISARDVNGDHAVDIVLTTAWFRQPVAVFLNDGHGNFSRVEPDAFPGAFSESTTSWACVSHQSMEAVGIPPQSRADICSEARELLYDRSQEGAIPPSSAGFVVSPLLISHAGRAPPSEIPQY
jgi:hypothetical protein